VSSFQLFLSKPKTTAFLVLIALFVPSILLVLKIIDSGVFSTEQLTTPFVYLSTLLCLCIPINVCLGWLRKNTLSSFLWLLFFVNVNGGAVLLLAIVAPILMLYTNSASLNNTIVTQQKEFDAIISKEIGNALKNSERIANYSWAVDDYWYVYDLETNLNVSTWKTSARYEELGLPFRCFYSNISIMNTGLYIKEMVPVVLDAIADIKIQPLRFAFNTLVFMAIPLSIFCVMKNFCRNANAQTCKSCGYILYEEGKCSECGAENTIPNTSKASKIGNIFKDIFVPTRSRPFLTISSISTIILIPIAWLIAQKLITHQQLTQFSDAWLQPLYLFMLMLLLPLVAVYLVSVFKKVTRQELTFIYSLFSIVYIAVLFTTIVSPVFLTTSQLQQAPTVPKVEQKIFTDMLNNVYEGLPNRTTEHIGLSTWAMDDHVVASADTHSGKQLVAGWEAYGIPYRCILAPLYFRPPRLERIAYFESITQTFTFSLLLPLPFALNTCIFVLIFLSLRILLSHRCPNKKTTIS